MKKTNSLFSRFFLGVLVAIFVVNQGAFAASGKTTRPATPKAKVEAAPAPVPAPVRRAPYRVKVKDESGETQVLVERSALKDLQAVSPAQLMKNLQRPKFGESIKEMTLHFPAEALQFYSVIGAFAIFECTLNYKKNPTACLDFFQSQADPLTYVSFYAFLLASQSTTHFGGMLGQVNFLRKSGLASQLLWGQLALAAGSIVSNLVEDLAHDKDIRLIATFMLRNKTPQDQKDIDEAWGRLEKKWFSYEGMDRMAPQVVGLIGSALASSGVTRLATWSATRLASTAVMKPLIARIPFRAGLMALGSARWVSGPINLAIFLIVDKIISPYVGYKWDEAKMHSKWVNTTYRLDEVWNYYRLARLDEETVKAARQSLKEWNDGQREWRDFLKRDFIESQAKWSRITVRFLSDVESTYRFYKSFVEAKAPNRVSNDGYHMFNALRAIDGNVFDWQQIGPYFPVELATFASAIDLGLSRDFVLGAKYIETVPFNEIDKESYSLHGLVNVLKAKPDLDRELAVKAINSGVNVDFALRGERYAIQKEIQRLQEIGFKLPPAQYEEHPLLLPDSKFDTDRQSQIVSAIGHIPYYNMTEKLMAHMFCGPRVEKGDTIASFPWRFWDIPRFHPPAIVTRDAEHEVCDRMENVYKGVWQGDNKISLVQFAKKNLMFKTSEEIEQWFRTKILPIVESSVSNFNQQQKEVAIDDLKPVWENLYRAKPVQNLVNSDQTLPLGLRVSISEQANRYLNMIRMLKRGLNETSRGQLESNIRLLSSFLRLRPSEFNNQDLSAHHKKIEECLRNIEDIVANDLLRTVPEDQLETHPVMSLVLEVLSDLSKLSFELAEIDITLAAK